MQWSHHETEAPTMPTAVSTATTAASSVRAISRGCDVMPSRQMSTRMRKARSKGTRFRPRSNCYSHLSIQSRVLAYRPVTCIGVYQIAILRESIRIRKRPCRTATYWNAMVIGPALNG